MRPLHVTERALRSGAYGPEGREVMEIVDLCRRKGMPSEAQKVLSFSVGVGPAKAIEYLLKYAPGLLADIYFD